MNLYESLGVNIERDIVDESCSISFDRSGTEFVLKDEELARFILASGGAYLTNWANKIVASKVDWEALKNPKKTKKKRKGKVNG